MCAQTHTHTEASTRFLSSKSTHRHWLVGAKAEACSKWYSVGLNLKSCSYKQDFFTTGFFFVLLWLLAGESFVGEGKTKPKNGVFCLMRKCTAPAQEWQSQLVGFNAQCY